jgi:GMP synthase (glutamine-hydrolysing)
MPSVVALTHVPSEDMGSLAEVLAERHYTIDSVNACTADLRKLDPSGPDLRVVPVGELQLIRQRLQSPLPAL